MSCISLQEAATAFADDYLRAFSQTRIPVRWPKAAPNLKPREQLGAVSPLPFGGRLGPFL